MFVICIESSHQRGLGHLFRSLILAEELRRREIQVVFAANEHQISYDIIAKRGFPVFAYDLTAAPGSWEPAWLAEHGQVSVWINDRLNTDISHSRSVKAVGAKLVTFDDRGDGAELAELNFAPLIFEETDKLKGSDVRAGVDYMILNPEIERYRRQRNHMTSILVTMGGADTYGVTVRVARWLCETGIPATVVTGPAFQHGKELADILSRADAAAIKHLNAVSSLVEEMSHHDLAITGGGVTPFEACAGGLPCVVIANELFEIPVGKALERLGAARFAGHHSAVDLGTAFRDLNVAKMSQAALRQVDLAGVKRVGDLVGDLGK